MTNVHIINKSGYNLPKYATDNSAGLDLRAALEEVLYISPMERLLVGTGLFMEIPQGHEAQIRPRSGMALKQGITVLNSPGTIDSDYRGEIKVLLINLSSVKVAIQPGDRIAQLIVSRYERIILEEVDELSNTQRGTGGYGHTGNN